MQVTKQLHGGVVLPPASTDTVMLYLGRVRAIVAAGPSFLNTFLDNRCNNTSNVMDRLFLAFATVRALRRPAAVNSIFRHS